ncbi:MAG: hypothetical protein ABW175_22110 [Bradyrhizobium sp.]
MYFTSDGDDMLVVQRSSHDRARTKALIAAAVVASFGLGWAGALSWPHVAHMAGLEDIFPHEASPRVAEARTGGKTEGTRKIAAASEAPAIVGSITRPSTLSPAVARPNAGAASQANVSAAAALAIRPVLTAPPETKPTTIAGWTVVDVRDGTAVLEGPDGIKMAARGDAVPGLGRIDSIVRWGNRWIVATANGLIATQ